MSKEIIELLETQAKDINSLKTFLKVTEIGNKEALVLLKQQPPAGEFTKTIRGVVADFVGVYGHQTDFFPPVSPKTIIDLCDRLDTAEASHKELLEALEKYGQHSQECHDERYPERWHCICGYEAAIAKNLEDKNAK